MKKILYLLILMMLLTGCSDAYAKLSSPNEDVFSVGDTSFSKSEVFNLMINQDPATLVIQMAKQKILEKEMPVSDEVTKQAKEELDYVKEIIGDEFLANIALYGFTSEQDYLDRALIPAAQEMLLIEKYVGDNLELLTTKYMPKKVRILEFDDVEKANSALQAIKDGENVEEVATKFSTSMTYNGKERLVHIESTLPEVVGVFVKGSSTPTLTNEPLLQESTSKYYVVQIVEITPSRFEDEIETELSALTSVNEMVFES
jgi:foldase protein PrsA